MREALGTSFRLQRAGFVSERALEILHQMASEKNKSERQWLSNSVIPNQKD
jgi:hypothetical protein